MIEQRRGREGEGERGRKGERKRGGRREWEGVGEGERKGMKYEKYPEEGRREAGGSRGNTFSLIKWDNKKVLLDISRICAMRLLEEFKTFIFFCLFFQKKLIHKKIK